MISQIEVADLADVLFARFLNRRAARPAGPVSLVVNSWDGVSAYSYAFSIPVTVNGPPLSVSTSVRYTMVNQQTQIPSVTTLTEAATGGVPPYTFTLSRDISSGPVQSAVPLQYLMSGFTSDRHALLTVTDSSASPQTVTKNLLIPVRRSKPPGYSAQTACASSRNLGGGVAGGVPSGAGADPSGVRNAIQSELGITAAQYGNTQIGSQSGLVLLASRLQASHAGNVTASKGAINSFHGGGSTARTASSAALNTLASSYTSDAALSAVYAPEVLNTVGGTPYSGSGYDANAWQLLGPYLGSCDPEYGCDPCDPDFDNCGSGPGSQIVTAYFDTQIVIDNPTGQFVAFSEEQVNTSGYTIVGDSGVCVSVTVSQGIVYGNPPQPVCDTFAYAISQVYGQATQAGTYTAVGTTGAFYGCVVDGNCYPIEIPPLTTRDSAQFSPPACSPPTIGSIVVNGQPISELVIPTTNGTMSISGACLDSTTQVSIGFDPSSDYAGNSSGVTVSNVTAPGWGVVNANYSVASGTMPETVVLTVTTSSGSATANMDVLTSGPYIDSINPVTWLPGTTTTVTISGSGFGTNQGSLTVAAPAGDVSLVNFQSWSDNSITMTVAADPNSAGETVTVTVTGGTDYGLTTGFQQVNGPGTGKNGVGQAYVAGGNCGDIRNALIFEYEVYQSDLQPTCASFQSLTMVVPGTTDLDVPAGSTTVPTSYINWSGYNWAIVSASLTSGLNSILASFQSAQPPITLGVTSAYRNPNKEYLLGGTVPITSRHVHGDAVDLNTSHSLQIWNNVHNKVSAALSGGIHYCIEPIDRSGGSSSGSTLSHLHVDWRPFMSNYAANAGCPTGWLQ